ncbi:MAG TPA: DUF998 domain-containing protein [Natronosporangium sp.]
MESARLRTIAGLLFLIAGALILLGIITGEAVYPASYRTHWNTISDLGGMRPPLRIVRQPSATIFNATMIVTGPLIVAGGILLQRAVRRPVVTVPVGLLGAGILGVGLFPGNTDPHPLFALFTFLAGGIAAAVSYQIVTVPLRYVCLALGIVSLASLGAGLFLLNWGPVAELGEGGIERWIAYPVVLWLVGFGGYLTHR